MVLDPIPQCLPVQIFGSRPQPPTSHYVHICDYVCICEYVYTYDYVCICIFIICAAGMVSHLCYWHASRYLCVHKYSYVSIYLYVYI